MLMLIFALAMAACLTHGQVSPPKVKAAFSSTVWDTSAPDNSTSTIQYLQTTLTVPALPSQQGVFLFPGLLAEGDWFVQTILTNDVQYLSPGYISCDTGGANGWCLQAWQYSASNPSGFGPSIIVSEGDQLEMAYQYNPSAGTMQQTTVLGRTGQMLIDWTHDCGPGYSLSFDIECHSPIENVPQHTYTETKIQLSAPNPSFNTTLHTNNSTPLDFTSLDGGTTWFIEEITLLTTSCG